MRLRIKLSGQEAATCAVHRLSVSDDCTLQQLRDHIRADIFRDIELTWDIRLSLNRKDELEGSPDATVKALGVCSGDTLWLLGASAPPLPPAEPVHAQPHPAPAAAAGGSSATAPEEDIVMRDEPALSATAVSPLDALAQLVHAALLDCGLALVQDANTAQLTGASEIVYCLSPAPIEEKTDAPPTCSVRHVPLGCHLTVWGSTRGGSSRHITLKLNDYITRAALASSSSSAADGDGAMPALQASNVSGLWAKLKDAFIHPLVAALCAEDGRPPPPGVQLLPTELKLLCLRNLQARDLASLACTCRDMRHVASSDKLWESLYAAEFGKPRPGERPALERIGLKRAFRQAWAERARMRRQRRRRFMQPGLPQPGTGPHLIVPNPDPFPSIAGGDYDRLPHPFLGLSRGGGVFGGSGAAGLGFPLSFSRGRRGAMQDALQ